MSLFVLSKKYCFNVCDYQCLILLFVFNVLMSNVLSN